MVNEKWTVNQEWIQSRRLDLTPRCYAGISGLVIWLHKLVNSGELHLCIDTSNALSLLWTWLILLPGKAWSQHSSLGNPDQKLSTDSGHKRKRLPMSSSVVSLPPFYHFWEAASCFLRSVMALSEDIRESHRLKGPTLLVTFCIWLFSRHHHDRTGSTVVGKAQTQLLHRAQEPPFSPLSASCLSSGNSKDTKHWDPFSFQGPNPNFNGESFDSHHYD